MAKIYGLFGSMKGKVADVVMAVRNGEQIVRKYQPVVTNPNTPAQVSARARLKLMSQLSSIMADVIAIPRDGVVSSRNRFVKENYPLASYDSTTDTASVPVTSIQLTRGVLSIGTINTLRHDQDGIYVDLYADMISPDLSRVVYVLFRKAGDSMVYGSSTVVTSPGVLSRWAATLPAYNGEAVVYAYGIRDNTEAARVAFGNIEIPSATTVANLVVSRTLLDSDITFTKTTGKILPAASE